LQLDVGDGAGVSQLLRLARLGEVRDVLRPAEIHHRRAQLLRPRDQKRHPVVAAHDRVEQQPPPHAPHRGAPPPPLLHHPPARPPPPARGHVALPVVIAPDRAPAAPQRAPARTLAGPPAPGPGPARPAIAVPEGPPAEQPLVAGQRPARVVGLPAPLEVATLG